MRSIACRVCACLAFVLVGAAGGKALTAVQDPAAQAPAVELKPQEVNLWEHREGLDDAVHLSGEEYQKLQYGQTYVEFEVLVSENGRVEQAKLTGATKVHVQEALSIEMDRQFKPWLRDGAKIRVKFHDYVLLLPPERWGDVRSPFPRPWDLQGASVQLERTPCFGMCPDYRVTIAGDGTVRYSGRRFVLIPGDHVAHIAPESVRGLIADFEKADFFSARDKYAASVTDNPTQILTLTVGGQTKTVEDYVGTRVGLPLAIRNLEKEVDDVGGTARWVKGDESTLGSLRDEKWPFSSSGKQNVELYDVAISKSNEELIEQFLANRGPVMATADGLDSPVCVASAKGNEELVTRMLRTAPKVQFPGAVLSQCLWSAARSGKVELVDFWLKKGASPNNPPKAGDPRSQLSLLATGILSDEPEMVSRLLGLSPDLQAHVMEEPLLTFALERGGNHAAAIVAELVKAGADVNARGRLGETPVFAAGYSPDAVKILLAAGADLEARNDNGDTALIRNAFRETMVRELLADGANPTLVNKRGETPLKVAHQYSCPSCASLLEDAVKNWRGNTTPPPVAP